MGSQRSIKPKKIKKIRKVGEDPNSNYNITETLTERQSLDKINILSRRHI